MAELEDMATEEEVVVRLTSMPQIISSESEASGGGGGGGGGGAGAAAARAASTSAGVELGRRLLLAARAGDTPQVLDLMAQGAPFTTDWLGTSPLHLAALGGHAGTCGVLLRAGVSRDARTKVERTPLHLAAHAGHLAVAGVLLDHGAMLDCRDMLRMTPLHWACARGHAALAALLARRGADVRARCKFRRTPLQLAAAQPAVLAALRRAAREHEDSRALQGMADTADTAEPAMIIQEVPAEEPAEQKPYEAAPAPGEDQPAGKLPQRTNKLNIENEQPQTGQTARGGAAALLRQHGITLLPADDGSTVLSALQSGRTVVLSDAGKLMLKENSAAAAPEAGAAPAAAAAAPAAAAPAAAAAAAPRAGVVLRACPARSPPRPGVKVFTVNKLQPARTPRDLQIKYVQLPPDATVLSPHKTAMKAKSKLARAVPVGAAAVSGAGAGSGAGSGAAGGRPGVKIIMNQASFGKLLATAARAHTAGDNQPLSLGGARGEAVVCVPEQFVRSSSARYLRAQLLAAHAALAELQRELGQARAALAAQQSGA